MTNHTPEALISSISGDYYLGNDAELELAKNIVAQLAAVTAQRDELLAASSAVLKMWNEIYPDMSSGKYPQSVLEDIEFGEMEKFRAAIAMVKL